VPSKHKLSAGILRQGDNTVSVTVGVLSRDRQHDHDDILFKNVRLDLPSAPDRLHKLCDQLRKQLSGKKYIELAPPPPINIAFVKKDLLNGKYVVAVTDARHTNQSPQQIFESVKDWFRTAIGDREHGVLLFIYDPALASTVDEIQQARFYVDSIWVAGGAYDLSTGEHWLSASGIENDMFE
jgi:hypothetical protein